MSNLLLKYGIASYVSEDTLVVPFQVDLYAEVVQAFRQEILHQLYHKPELKGLILDVSHLFLLDVDDMEILEETLKMASVYDVEAYVVGVQADVALALIGLGYEGKINTSPTVRQAIERIHNRTEAKQMHRMQEVLEQEEVMQDDEECQEILEEDMDDS